MEDLKNVDKQISRELLYEKYKYSSMDKLKEDLIIFFDKFSEKINLGGFNKTKLDSLLKEIDGDLKAIYSDFKLNLNKDASIQIKSFILAELISFNVKKMDNSILEKVLKGENEYILGYKLVDMINTQKSSAFNRIRKYLAVELLKALEVAKSVGTGFKNLVNGFFKETKSIASTFTKYLREKARNEVEKKVGFSGGWLSLAVLDGKTTPICIKLHNFFYSAEKYSRDTIPNPIPRHFNCRSMYARVDNESELKNAKGIDFNSFLKRNPNIGREVMGNKKYNLLIDNKLEVNSLIDLDNNRFFTNEEIEKLLN